LLDTGIRIGLIQKWTSDFVYFEISSALTKLTCSWQTKLLWCVCIESEPRRVWLHLSEMQSNTLRIYIGMYVCCLTSKRVLYVWVVGDDFRRAINCWNSQIPQSHLRYWAQKLAEQPATSAVSYPEGNRRIADSPVLARISRRRREPTWRKKI